MVAGGGALGCSGHASFNASQQANLERWTQMAFHESVTAIPKDELRQHRARQAGLDNLSDVASSRPVSPWIPDVAAEMAKQSRLVRISEARRAEPGLSFVDMPRRLHRLPTAPRRRPITPPGESTDEWAEAARHLDRAALTRVLHGLQAKLNKSTHSRRHGSRSMEESVAPCASQFRKGGTPSGCRSLPSLPAAASATPSRASGVRQ